MADKAGRFPRAEVWSGERPRGEGRSPLGETDGEQAPGALLQVSGKRAPGAPSYEPADVARLLGLSIEVVQAAVNDLPRCWNLSTGEWWITEEQLEGWRPALRPEGRDPHLQDADVVVGPGDGWGGRPVPTEPVQEGPWVKSLGALPLGLASPPARELPVRAVLSLFIAGAAFIVAVLALYFSTLRPAHIIITPASGDALTIAVSSGSAFPPGQWPTEVRLNLGLVAYNVGARAGYTQRLRVTRFEEVGGGPPLFDVHVPFPLSNQFSPMAAGDVLSASMFAPLTLTIRADEGQEATARERLLERLVGGSGVRLTLSYQTVRGRTFPLRRRASIKHDDFEVDVSLAQFIEAVRGGLETPLLVPPEQVDRFRRREALNLGAIWERSRRD